MSRIAGFTVALMLVAAVAGAQDWRGTGRLSGKVVDEQGNGIEGIVVNASLPSIQRGVLAQGKTDKKGEWSIDDVAEGNWELTFESDKYEPAKATADVDENGRSSPVRTKMKRKFDPNAFIQEQGKKVNALINEKKYAEARAVCQEVLAKVPEVANQVQPIVARTYFLEGNNAQATEVAKATLAKDPANLEAKFILMDVYLKTGAIDDAIKVINGIDESKITDMALYVNLGITLTNNQKPTEALQYLDKAVARFPQAPEPYFYRANAMVPIVNAKTDPKDPERIATIAKMKADLNKYLQMAPNGPEAESARKLLEQIDKQNPQ